MGCEVALSLLQALVDRTHQDFISGHGGPCQRSVDMLAMIMRRVQTQTAENSVSSTGARR